MQQAGLQRGSSTTGDRDQLTWEHLRNRDVATVPEDLFKRRTVYRKYVQLEAMIHDLEDKLRRGRESDNVKRAVWADLAASMLHRAGHDEFVRALHAERDAEIAAERVERSIPPLRQKRTPSGTGNDTEKPVRASPVRGDAWLANVSGM